MNFIKLLIFAGVLIIALVTTALAFPVFLFVTQLPVPSTSIFCNIAVAINIALMIAVNIYIIKIYLLCTQIPARFCLDSMNTKSLDIDKRLNDDLISEEEARAEKKALKDEVDFYCYLNGGAGLLKIATVIISIIYVATLVVGTFVGIKFHAMQWHLSLATYANLSLPFFLLIELLVIITATWIKSSASKFWENGGFYSSTIEKNISETRDILQVAVGDSLLGRVIDVFGNPYDSLGNIETTASYPVLRDPPNPMSRKSISEKLCTGVHAIDSLLAISKGQMVGIYGGSLVGKTSLLDMIARNNNADVNVIGFIGGRGQEVLDFIDELGKECLARSVFVVATSDRPSIERVRLAQVCTSIAEYFSDQGKDVVLMIDSLTRFAQSQREIGLANDEPAIRRGYTPSVFDMLSKLIERAGTSDKGTITGFYSVLVDDDDNDEPISDKVKELTDVHIFLSSALAMANHYPAIDFTRSVNRLKKR